MKRAVAVLGRMLRRALTAIGVLVIAVTCTPLISWWARALAGHWSPAQGGILVVLSGSDLEDGILGYSSYWRAVYAVLAYRTKVCSEVLISGGGQPGVSIAESMRDFLLASGVPETTIRLEVESRTTWESAQRVKTLLDAERRPILLLTSDYHMFRAHRMFEKAGLKTHPWPAPDAIKRSTSWYLRWWVFLDLLKESGAIAYSWARGRI